MLIFNKGSDNSVGSAIISCDPIPQHIEQPKHSDERPARAYALRRIKSNVFSLPLPFRAAMEGDGGKESGGTGEGKAAGKLRADENDNASRAHV